MAASFIAIPSPAIADTELPTSNDDASVYLRSFILNSRLALKANDKHRTQLLKDAVEMVVLQVVADHTEKIAEQIACGLVEELLGEESNNALDLSEFDEQHDNDDETVLLSDADLAKLH